MCLHMCSHTVKLAAGPKGIGLNLNKSHPIIIEELVTRAGASKVLTVVQTTWLCLVLCGNQKKKINNHISQKDPQVKTE